MSRTAYGYLLVEDRRPREWRRDGDAVITKVYANKPTEGQVPAGSRVIKVRLNLPDGFFTPVVEIDVNVSAPTGTAL